MTTMARKTGLMIAPVLYYSLGYPQSGIKTRATTKPSSISLLARTQTVVHLVVLCVPITE